MSLNHPVEEVIPDWTMDFSVGFVEDFEHPSASMGVSMFKELMGIAEEMTASGAVLPLITYYVRCYVFTYSCVTPPVLGGASMSPQPAFVSAHVWLSLMSS